MSNPASVSASRSSPVLWLVECFAAYAQAK